MSCDFCFFLLSETKCVKMRKVNCWRGGVKLDGTLGHWNGSFLWLLALHPLRPVFYVMKP